MIAAVMMASLWSGWLLPILEIVVGLGLVIFIHELGHFLVAKAVGIRVERFAIGFGPRLFGLVIGETDYCVRALPLGGYIKMLGQDDLRPAGEPQEIDPRSFNGKPVWARMCVVSAGVVMNIVLAGALFVIVSMVGKDFPAPVVGGARKHFPAAETRIAWRSGPGPTTRPVVTTGLKAGDRIVRIERSDSAILAILGNEVTRFSRLALLAILADPQDKFTMTVQRDVDGNEWVGTAEVGVRKGPSEMGGERLTFGLMSAADTQVDTRPDYVTAPAIDPFHDKDRVVAVAGRPTPDIWDIQPILQDLPGGPVTVTVDRKGKRVDLQDPLWLRLKDNVVYETGGRKLDLDDYEIGREDGKFVLTSLLDKTRKVYEPNDLVLAGRDEILDLLGMVPRLVITGVVKDSGAAEAGLRPGDVIVSYGDQPTPTIAQLIEVNKKTASEQAGTQIVVERDGKTLDPIRIRPRTDNGSYATIGIYRDVDMSHTVVASVRPNSPAAKAGLEHGCVIDKVNDQPVKTWSEIHDALRKAEGQPVKLTYRPADRSDAAPAVADFGVLSREAFDPGDYEYSLFAGPQKGFHSPLRVTVKKHSIGEALAWGARETGGFVLTTYATLRSLIMGTVSRRDVLGPIGMGKIAFEVGRESSIDLVYFMAFISATIAVLNFLPFPVVDGGLFVFLIIEKVRGRPVPVKVMNVVQMIGLALLLLVFLAVTFQDISRFF